MKNGNRPRRSRLAVGLVIITSEVIASLEVNEVIDDTFCDSFNAVSMSATIVVNFERSANFANFVNFKNIQLAKLELIMVLNVMMDMGL